MFTLSLQFHVDRTCSGWAFNGFLYSFSNAWTLSRFVKWFPCFLLCHFLKNSDRLTFTHNFTWWELKSWMRCTYRLEVDTLTLMLWPHRHGSRSVPDPGIFVMFEFLCTLCYVETGWRGSAGRARGEREPGVGVKLYSIEFYALHGASGSGGAESRSGALAGLHDVLFYNSWVRFY